MDERTPGQNYTNSRWPDESALDTPEPISHRSIPALFFQRAEEHPNSTYVSFKQDGSWRDISWREASQHVALLAYFLRRRFDLRKEQRVSILSATRYEWLIADLAILSAGAISTPIYHSLTAPEVGYILWNADSDLVFAENQEQLEKLTTIDKEKTLLPKTEGFRGGKQQLRIRATISFEDVESERFNARLFSFWEIVKGQSEKATIEITQSVARSLSSDKAVNRESLASIVYTSGTTGPPKGVVQTHGNHLSMLESVNLSGLLGAGNSMFLFLPLAHSFARLVAYSALGSSGSLILPSIVDKERSIFDAKQLFQDVRETEPEIFPSVPRLFEKVMTGIMGKLAERPASLRDRIQKRLANWALKAYPRLEEKRASKGQLGVFDSFWHTLASGVVARIRESVFGSKLCYCISGGAPLDISVAKFFNSIGALICEGYGLTETSPAISANTSSFNKFGSVGRIFAGVEVKIAKEDAEILARGENIAKGYFKMPKATKAVFSEDGWFATGDIGRIDDEGYLFITDRKKDLIVTAGGKNVAPALIEGRTKASPFISQVLVYGDKKPYLVALITLDEENVNKKTADGETNDSLLDLCQSATVHELISKEVERLNADYASYEQIKRFALVPEDFTVENGLLSPTMKMKRKPIIKKYHSEIEELYIGVLVDNSRD